MAAVLESAAPVSHAPSTEHRALRFLTAGSVDDGKSTLIGRLLYDSRAILADQLDALHARAAGEPIDLSLLTDGLEAEREQGITIDVAYRYFATRSASSSSPTRRATSSTRATWSPPPPAATPPWCWWTSPRSTGAPPVVELLPQTRRHALLAQLLRVPSIVFAVNKLDAVDEPGAAFEAVRDALLRFARSGRHRRWPASCRCRRCAATT